MDIKKQRQRIDKIDERLIALLNDRAKMSPVVIETSRMSFLRKRGKRINTQAGADTKFVPLMPPVV